MPGWMDGPFTELDADVVAADCDKWWRSSAKLCKVRAGCTGCHLQHDLKVHTSIYVECPVRLLYVQLPNLELQ
jgi:hypothetical protein